MLANATHSVSGRPFHALATDELLEMLQGFVKFKSNGGVANAEVHSACNYFLNEVQARMERVSKGASTEEQETKGVHVKDGKADTDRMAKDKLRRFKLFDFSKPRKSLAELPQSAHGALFPSGYEPPAAFVAVDAGGPINFALLQPPSTEATPALQRAAAFAEEMLKRTGVLDGIVADAPQEQHAAQEAEAHDGHCGICNSAVRFEQCQGCDECLAICCPACVVHFPDEKDADGNAVYRCRACLGRTGDAEEAEARADAEEFIS